MMPSISQSGQISLTSLGRQDVDLDADRLGDAGVIHVLVPAVLGAGEADVGDLAEADMLAGLCFERLVERHRVFVDLADRVAEVEERQQARRMPGRARGQLLALDEDDVATSPSWRDDRASRRRPRRRRSPPRARAFSSLKLGLKRKSNQALSALAGDTSEARRRCHGGSSGGQRSVRRRAHASF